MQSKHFKTQGFSYSQNIAKYSQTIKILILYFEYLNFLYRK